MYTSEGRALTGAHFLAPGSLPQGWLHTVPLGPLAQGNPCEEVTHSQGLDQSEAKLGSNSAGERRRRMTADCFLRV
jgi:hypothetical protein